LQKRARFNRVAATIPLISGNIMLKKSLLLLCLYSSFSYSFDADKFDADIHGPQFQADTPKGAWESYIKNTVLTDFAIRLIEIEKKSTWSKEEHAHYQNSLVQWLTRSAIRATGKQSDKLHSSLEQELLQRKFELEQADLKRQAPPPHLGFLCLYM
jgi:hypothetical protein